MASYARKRNKDGSSSWVAQVRVRGFKPTAKSFEKREAAEVWAEDLERELRRDREGGNLSADVTQLTIAKLAREYLADPETQALRYYEKLEAYLGWWIDKYGSTKVLRCGAAILRAARNRLSADKKPATVNRYMAALRSAWNWGHAAEMIPDRHAWPRRLMLTEPKARDRHLGDDERQSLLDAAEAHSPQMYAAVLVSIATGLRLSELLRLTWRDVDYEKNRLRVHVTKNDQPRAVYLLPEAADVLRELADEPKSSAAVFVDDDGNAVGVDWIETRWKKIRTAAKLDNFRWHDLRHTAASYLAQHGASLVEIGAVLGHKSPATSARYAHLVQGAPVTGHARLGEKLRKR
jgi:integrase